MTTRRDRPLHQPVRHRRPTIPVAAALVAVAALAGCGGAMPEGRAAAPITTAAAAPAEAAMPPAAAVETAVAIPAPAPEPERQYPEPETLRGLDADRLSGLLGAPRLKRRDDPAEIWQYRNEACALDVFLYRAGKDGAYTVRHFEARGPGRKPVDQKACFVSLLKAHEKGRAG